MINSCVLKYNIPSLTLYKVVCVCESEKLPSLIIMSKLAVVLIKKVLTVRLYSLVIKF